MDKILVEALQNVVILGDEIKRLSLESLPDAGKGYSFIDITEVPDCPEAEEKEAELRDYLGTLDFELIKDIQTVMYLGRDRDYDKNESFDERFASERKHMDANGWSEREVEIEIIIEKTGLLSEYLRKGMEILGV